ncbi:HNH endonuclease [Photobacterium rosenbergii]|uniref:HNH endonuclease n=1 Tax=Photobacterium rosenbergii TaxID=294936 RepID=A0A2T3N9X9_9GAMM|nr:HNH endonuclease [Photobacterium rosenbergii]PSW10327.1 HNH endonuclease [Photobacterium rosenbergii]
MNYKTLYEKELSNPDTNFFILDTKGSGVKHDDADFIKYSWRTNKFGLVNVGDLFIYRRPGKASETGKFYFFGAGKIETIASAFDTKGEVDDEKRVNGAITKPLPFVNDIHPEDLEDFDWHFKDRKPDTWMYFFNQYGMNKIDREDFIALMDIAEDGIDSDYDNTAATEALQDIQNENYHAEDEKSAAARRSKQSVFSNKVKNNYGNTCALCGIQTKSFLIGSHIIPWAKRKDIRLDPSNGISLCVMHDKLFDSGYITLNADLKVVVSDAVNQDPSLQAITELIKGKKLRKPKKSPPKKEYLDYHREKVFEKFLNK